jgi:hypothetical protein
MGEGQSGFPARTKPAGRDASKGRSEGRSDGIIGVWGCAFKMGFGFCLKALREGRGGPSGCPTGSWRLMSLEYGEGCEVEGS